MNNSLVFISYAFPPYNSIASQRSIKLVSQLLNHYQLIYILTLDLKEIPSSKTDYNLNSEFLSNERIKIIQVPLNFLGYEDSSNAFFLKKLVSGFFTRIFCSNGIFWYLPLKQVIKKIISQNSISMLFVTGPPFVSFFLINRFAKRNKIPYLLDYRDLWTSNPRVPAFSFSKRVIQFLFEKKCLSGAKAVLTVSDGCANSLISQGANIINTHVVRNLPDKEYVDFFFKNYIQINQDKNTVDLVLTGSVYASCTFWPILDALKIAKPEIANVFHFHYYGSSSLLVTKEFEKYNMLNFLTDHGHVSKEDSIRALGNADILISLVDDGKNGYDDAIAGLMTTKIFDYFLTGKPILSIGPTLSNINTFAQEINYNNYFSFESYETKSILSFLSLVQLNNNKMHSDKLCLPFFEEEFQKISNIFT